MPLRGKRISFVIARVELRILFLIQIFIFHSLDNSSAICGLNVLTHFTMLPAESLKTSAKFLVWTIKVPALLHFLSSLPSFPHPSPREASSIVTGSALTTL